jgi:hypothetical protein
VAATCERRNEPLVSVKGRKCRDWLSVGYRKELCFMELIS